MEEPHYATLRSILKDALRPHIKDGIEEMKIGEEKN
jgi:hypothetical protein